MNSQNKKLEMNQMHNSKDFILNKIRKAKQSGAHQGLAFQLLSSEKEAEIFVQPTGDLSLNFAKELENINGTCYLVKNNSEMLETLRLIVSEQKISNILCLEETIISTLTGFENMIHDSMEQVNTSTASITNCEFLISRTGSVMVSNMNESGRKPHVYPDNHIVLAKSNQVVPDINQAIDALCNKYKENFPSWVSLITGPSRTADIEKTLILGAHGPKKLFVIIVK